jgi:hypothetical protein
MTTTDTDKYIIRRLTDIETERGVCGWRKTLVTHDDTPVANVSHLTIDNSRYHYHREMTEFYYVLSGGSRSKRAISSSSSRASGTPRMARWNA